MSASFKGCVLTVNYPDDEVEAAIPSELTVLKLAYYLNKLLQDEPDATSLVFVASIQREKSNG